MRRCPGTQPGRESESVGPCFGAFAPLSSLAGSVRAERAAPAQGGRLSGRLFVVRSVPEFGVTLTVTLPLRFVLRAAVGSTGVCSPNPWGNNACGLRYLFYLLN